MSKRIQFQFDDKLQFQLDAVSSVVRLFDGLPQKVGGIYEKAVRRGQQSLIEPTRNIEITVGN